MSGSDRANNTRGRMTPYRQAFTLIELLVVIAIIGLLISILMPALSSARSVAKSAICLTRLRTAGQGMVLYANDNRDTMVPGRLPKVNDHHWRIRVLGGLKYRPSFLTMMESQVGLTPFADPQPSRSSIDKFGQPGDRQNYFSEQYVCPEVPDWTDERNGAYGYNYQFLGNARLFDVSDLSSYKNWPIKSSRIKSPARCVGVADSLGTAASFPTNQRGSYEDNDFGDSKSGRSLHAKGNEGFNLDPPRIDIERGEAASLKNGHVARTSIDERHRGKGNVLWMDGHASPETLRSLGYEVDDQGVVGFEGDNRFFHINSKDQAWVE